MQFTLNNGDVVQASPQYRDYLSVDSNKRIYNNHSSNVTISIDGVSARILPFSDDIEIRQGTINNNYISYNYSTVTWRKGVFSDSFYFSLFAILLTFLVLIKVWRTN